MSYQLTEKIYLKANLSRGFRSPNIAELGANGVHEGVGRYEIGNADLNPEFSLQKDIGLALNTEHVTFELDAFHNAISNFIYISKLTSVNGGDSIIDPADPIPTFKFRQGNAQLFGGEFLIDIHPHPLDWLHIENSFDIVRAIQSNVADSLRNLPFTPGPRIQSQVRTDFRKTKGAIQNIFAKAELQYYFKQDKAYTAFNTETITPAYTLINLSFGADVFHKDKKRASLYVGVNNLFDIAYQNHLSRLKYSDVNYATGYRGVFNMGRNISIKLLIPLQISSKKPV